MNYLAHIRAATYDIIQCQRINCNQDRQLTSGRGQRTHKQILTLNRINGPDLILVSFHQRKRNTTVMLTNDHLLTFDYMGYLSSDDARILDRRRVVKVLLRTEPATAFNPQRFAGTARCRSHSVRPLPSSYLAGSASLRRQPPVCAPQAPIAPNPQLREFLTELSHTRLPSRRR